MIGLIVAGLKLGVVAVVALGVLFVGAFVVGALMAVIGAGVDAVTDWLEGRR